MRSCDICNVAIDEQQAYFLTTKEVVTSEAYWKASLPRMEGVLELIGAELDIAQQLIHVVGRMAQCDTPYIVCGQCFSLFSLDQTERKRKADNWLSTGEPAGGLALCRVEYKGADIIIDSIDDDGMMAAIRVATDALQALPKFNSTVKLSRPVCRCCGVSILVTTAGKTGGFCIPCHSKGFIWRLLCRVRLVKRP